MRERWRDIFGYEGLYKVSDWGRVRSLDRIVRHKRFGTMRVKGRILRLALSGSYSKYLSVNLYKAGVQTTTRVHRLVAAAFLGPCPDGMEVCHNDGNSVNNIISNLRYDTRANNCLDRRREGTHCGQPVKRSDGITFINMHVAAEESGCHATNICRVCTSKGKTAGGYGWEYAEISI